MSAAIKDGLGDVLSCKVTDIAHAGRALGRGREDVVKALVGACVDVKCVDAALLKPLDELLGLFEGTAAFPAVVKSDAEQDRHVRADYGADGLDHLTGKAGAVLGRAAVLIGAVVEHLGHELVDEVACVGVDLDSVKACVAGNACCVLKRLLKILDLLPCHLTGEDIGLKEGGLHAGGDELVAKLVGVAVAAGARGHLEADLCAPAVDSLDKVGVCGDGDVAIKGAFVGALCDLLGERSAAGDYHADAASGALFKVIDLPVGLCSVREGCVVAHRRKHEAVLDLHLAYLKRGKKRAVIFLFHFDLLLCLFLLVC